MPLATGPEFPLLPAAPDDRPAASPCDAAVKWSLPWTSAERSLGLRHRVRGLLTDCAHRESDWALRGGPPLAVSGRRARHSESRCDTNQPPLQRGGHARRPLPILTSRPNGPSESFTFGTWGISIVAAIVACVRGIYGIGGGSIIAPILIGSDRSPREVAPATLAATFVTSVAAWRPSSRCPCPSTAQPHRTGESGWPSAPVVCSVARPEHAYSDDSPTSPSGECLVSLSSQ